MKKPLSKSAKKKLKQNAKKVGGAVEVEEGEEEEEEGPIEAAAKLKAAQKQEQKQAKAAAAVLQNKVDMKEKKEKKLQDKTERAGVAKLLTAGLEAAELKEETLKGEAPKEEEALKVAAQAEHLQDKAAGASV